MIDFDQLKRDRETGTLNNLADHLRNGQQCDEDGVMCIVSRQACHEAADILARVPDLEALALAGQDMAEALRRIHDSEISRKITMMERLQNIDHIAFVALAAWDKAVKGETNDQEI